MSDDIKLPPLPYSELGGLQPDSHASRAIEAWGRAAVQADRAAQMHDNSTCISKLAKSDKQDQSGGVTEMVEDHVEGVRHMVPSDDDLLGCAGVTRHHDAGMPMIIGTADIRRFADCVRKQWSQPETGKSVLAGNQDVTGQMDTSIDIADVRQYLDQWGCLAHPGVRALLSRCGNPHVGQPAASAEPVAHTDDDAVDHFAAAMKDKLAQARAKGRHGWQECDPSDLSQMLRAHVEKGDPRDVANFCCFLWSLGKPISAAPVAQEPVAYLDLGAGGYMDVGTDLTDGQLAALPKGRHMLAIVGTYGVDGFSSTPVAAQAQPSGNSGELPSDQDREDGK